MFGKALQYAIYALLSLNVFSTAAIAQRIVIKGATVINVRDGSLKPNSTVVLEGDQITSITTNGSAGPAGGTVIDASGKYVIPGLIDPHLHYKEWAPELFLNHGVTAVLDLGNDYEWIKAQKEGIAGGRIPGPRLFVATRRLNGAIAGGDSSEENPIGFEDHLLKTPKAATEAMQKYIADGVDAVKVLDRISSEVLSAVVQEAHKVNIPVAGHFPDIVMAANTGAEGVEHIAPIAHVIVDKTALEEASKKVRKGFQPPETAFMDMKRVPEIVNLMLKKGLYFNPTLRNANEGGQKRREKRFEYEEFDLLLNEWRLRYVPIQWKLAVLKLDQQMGLWHWKEMSPDEQGLMERGYENLLTFTKAFADAGGKLYAGTDCPNRCVPGLGLHQELQLMVEAARVSPLQALQAATINAAEFMRKKELGVIEIGKAADLVILDANPLQDIRNTRKIFKVISRGRLLDGRYNADFKNPIPRNGPETDGNFFPAPVTRKVTPEIIVEGTSSATLTLEGTGFVPQSFVRWNGRKLKTEFSGVRQLKAVVPGDLLIPGTYSVTVENPDFGWGGTGAELEHLGVRGPISNEFLVIVKFKVNAR
jgi:imidazolonepropionase-like amidohydrolase